MLCSISFHLFKKFEETPEPHVLKLKVTAATSHFKEPRPPPLETSTPMSLLANTHPISPSTRQVASYCFARRKILPQTRFHHEDDCTTGSPAVRYSLEHPTPPPSSFREVLPVSFLGTISLFNSPPRKGASQHVMRVCVSIPSVSRRLCSRRRSTLYESLIPKFNEAAQRAFCAKKTFTRLA